MTRFMKRMVMRIMMRTRNHLKTDTETKGESDEDNQPGEIGQ